MKRPKKVKVYKLVTFTKTGNEQGLEGSKALPLSLAVELIAKGFAEAQEDTKAPTPKPKSKPKKK